MENRFLLQKHQNKNNNQISFTLKKRKTSPDILFEVLYISNEEDREKILNNLPDIAKAIAETAEESFEGNSI